MANHSILSREFYPQTQQCEPAFEHLTNSLRAVLRMIDRQQAVPQILFCRAETGLNALPLGTDVYARARLNLRNVEQYTSQSEFGAARFEVLSLLRRILKYRSCIGG